MQLITLVKKYKSILLYLIFGALTTLINIVAYSALYYSCGISNTVSNVIAWIVCVIFAFVTNKLYVFDSKDCSCAVIFKELVPFVTCRLATLAIDLIIMYVTIDVLHWTPWLMKMIANVVVIVLNYVASKLLIFAKKALTRLLNPQKKQGKEPCFFIVS